MKIDGNLNLKIDRSVETTYEIGWKWGNSLAEVYGNWFSTLQETRFEASVAFSSLSFQSQ